MTHLRLYNPATHIVVPREPTPEMLDAPSSCASKDVSELYAAMLAAAPDASRPLPTRDEIARVLFYALPKAFQIHLSSHWDEVDSFNRNGMRNVADAVLALLEGSGKEQK